MIVTVRIDTISKFVVRESRKATKGLYRVIKKQIKKHTKSV